MLDGTLSKIPSSTINDSKIEILSKSERFELGLLTYRKSLMAFACSLARDIDVADELVQETILRALSRKGDFDFDTNLRAWLFTILRNLFISHVRKERHSVALTHTITNSARHALSDQQESVYLLKQVIGAVGKLPKSQRSALVLVGALGYSVEEVARLDNCRPGTVKSRASRGRKALSDQFD